MREKLLGVANRRPFIFVLGLMCLYLLYMTPFQMMKQNVTSYWFMAAVEIVPAAAAAFLIHTMGWWRETGFAGPLRWRSLWVITLPVIIMLLNYHGFGVTISNFLGGLVLCFLIGFEEEAFSRGLYLQVMIRRYGLMTGAFLTSALFGLGHLHNLLGGAPVLGVLVQIIMAAGLGFVFVAVRLRTNSIWPAIIIHMLIDVASFMGGSVQVQDESVASLIPNLIISLVLFGYGYLSLRGLAARNSTRA